MLLLSAALAFAAFVLPGGTPARPVTLNAVPTSPATPLRTPSEPAALAPLPHPARPTTLVVPALGVHAQVQSLVADDGVLTPPGDVTQVGWWAGGPKPGAENGHVLITGHTVHTGGGVFDDLGALSVGDGVRVDTEKGPMTYEVTKIRYLSIAGLAAASSELFTFDGAPRLVLVTCAGWDGAAYHGNTVVVARPVGLAGRPDAETPATGDDASGAATEQAAPLPVPSPAPARPSEVTTPTVPGLLPPEGLSYW